MLGDTRLPFMAEAPDPAVSLEAGSYVDEHGVRHRADQVRWQCKVDSDLWSDYPLEICRFIEGAWNAATERWVSLDAIDDNYSMYTVDVVALVQMNTWTQARRPLRRIIVTHG